jgi:hypothetical protein
MLREHAAWAVRRLTREREHGRAPAP